MSLMKKISLIICISLSLCSVAVNRASAQTPAKSSRDL